MTRSIDATLVLALGILLTWSARAQGAEEAQDRDKAHGARILLTKFDVNDTALDLGFTITNDSDHEIWVCDYIGADFEVYLARDEQTLVLRRRFDVPTLWYWPEPPLGLYVRLRPGDERAECVSLALPADGRVVFLGEEELGQGEYASRLALEVGFYDEDLPALVSSVLAVAENCHVPITEANRATVERFFPGAFFRAAPGASQAFEQSHADEIEQGRLVLGYRWEPRLGEQVLRTEVKGVHIPYRMPKWLTPATDNPHESGGEQQADGNEPTARIVLTRFETRGETLDLSFQIRNDSDCDIWICDAASLRSSRFDIFWAQDEQAVVIRRRHDVPIEGSLPYGAITGKYVRLGPNATRTESLVLTLPVHWRGVFVEPPAIQGIVHARQLILEIGYYAENLPEMIRAVLTEAGKFNGEITSDNSAIVDRYFLGLYVEAYMGELRYFEEANQGIDTNEEVLAPYAFQTLTGEQAARLIVDGVFIPYENVRHRTVAEGEL